MSTRFINRGRGSGKTYMMVATSYMTGYPIVCKTNMHKENILDTADKMGATIEVFTYDERMSKGKYNKLCYSAGAKLLVDEGEDILKDALERQLDFPVAAVTMSLPMVGQQNEKL